MKIAFLSFYSGEVYRGVETYVFELANSLVELGNEVTVYQNGPRLKNTRYKTVSVGLPVDWNQKGIEGRFLGIPFTDYYACLVGRFTKLVLERVDLDTDVLVTTNGSLQILFSRFWALIHKIKLVVTGQSGPGMDDRWNLWCFPDVFVGLTKYQCEWARKVNPFVRVHKISNGVDLNKFISKTSPLDIDLPHPIVLSVAALEKSKRLDLLINAIAKLKKVSLLLVGRGSEEEKLKKLAQNLLGKRFKIISLPFDKMPHVYTSCDLFSYPPVPWESFGIVMLEAMASGLPIVATDDPIRREIVGDSGLFVDPTNTSQYAEILNKALKMKWGNTPRKQAEKFSWDKVAYEYERLFKSLVK